MSRIPEQVIDDVQSRLDIAEVIGRFVPLKRAGRHFKGLCPFHKERTPSFMVNTDKQIFHCFGCGVGGNVFSFLMQHDRLTFPEALRQLAEQAGIQLPQTQTQTQTQTQPAGQSTSEMAALMDKVCGYFERSLKAAQGASARTYLKQRGVSEAAAKVFRLGLAPQGWDHLLKAAQSTGVSPLQLEVLGLVVRRSDGESGLYDRFRNRLLFPILDVRGRIVGFGGRSLDGKEPKYLNSPETPLYTKGRHLFGLAQAREAIVEKKTVVVVEGYFDCVVLHAAGIGNVVSPSGTALTVEQARLLKRYAEKVILAFDADLAGEQAALRGIDVLVETGLSVHVAQLPQGVDPDEVLQQQGRQQLEAIFSKSLTIFDFLLQNALKRHPGRTVEERVKAAQFVLPILGKVPNAMLRQEYVRMLSGRLKLDEQAIVRELVKTAGRGQWQAAGEAPARAPAQAVGRGPEALFVAMILDDPKRWVQARQEGLIEALTDPALQQVLAAVDALQASRPAGLNTAQVVSRLVAQGQDAMVASLMQLLQEMPAQEHVHVFEDCARRLKAAARQRTIAGKLAELHSAQQAGQTNETRRLLSEYQELLVQAKGG